MEHAEGFKNKQWNLKNNPQTNREQVQAGKNGSDVVSLMERQHFGPTAVGKSTVINTYVCVQSCVQSWAWLTTVRVTLRLPVTPLSDLTPTQCSKLQDLNGMVMSSNVNYMRPPPPHNYCAALRAFIAASDLVWSHPNAYIQGIRIIKTTCNKLIKMAWKKPSLKEVRFHNRNDELIQFKSQHPALTPSFVTAGLT